jgi:hypothetical protein
MDHFQERVMDQCLASPTPSDGSHQSSMTHVKMQLETRETTVLGIQARDAKPAVCSVSNHEYVMSGLPLERTDPSFKTLGFCRPLIF